MGHLGAQAVMGRLKAIKKQEGRGDPLHADKACKGWQAKRAFASKLSVDKKRTMALSG